MVIGMKCLVIIVVFLCFVFKKIDRFNEEGKI